MSSVSLIRCDSYESRSMDRALKRVVEPLGGMSRFVKPGDRVLIKPNLLLAKDPEKRVTTDPAMARSVASLVMEAGGRPMIGDSPALDGFGRVARRCGMVAVSRDLGIELTPLTEPVRVATPPGSPFRQLEIAAQALDADVVINLPKLKTHSQMLLTLGVKNLFGTIVAQRKAEWHMMAGVDRDTFASLLLDIYLTVKPALTILDGIWGMDGHGPANGRPVRLNLMAAATDAVALDISICRMLKIPLRFFPLYRVAKTRGVGETDPARLTFIGDPLNAFTVSRFETPTLDSVGFLPSHLDWFTKRFLVSIPVHDGTSCVGCGACSEICPAHAVDLKGKRVAFNYDDCIRCYCCQEVCPQDAIQFKTGWLVKLLNRLNR